MFNEGTMQPRGKPSLECAMKCFEERNRFQESSEIAAQVGREIAESVAMNEFDKLQYILANQEKAVEHRCGRKPSGRPLLMWPNGKIRIEFLGTFSSVHDAHDRVSRIMIELQRCNSQLHRGDEIGKL